MVQVIQNTNIKAAKKDYECMACLFLRDGDTWDFMTFSEKRAVVKARQNGWKIKKGEPYTKQFNKMDGDTYTFRAIPAIHAICLKYDLYPEV